MYARNLKVFTKWPPLVNITLNEHARIQKALSERVQIWHVFVLSLSTYEARG